MKTRAQIRAEFQVEWDRARAIFPFMAANPVVDNFDPRSGADGYFDPTVDGPHFQFAIAYAPPLGISWSHRYLHEIGHYIDYMLRVFGLAKPYIRQRHWAWRFRGHFNAPDSWNDQQRAADKLSGQDNWSNLPVEMFAEAFVVCVMGYVEQERTMNWGITMPLDARVFFQTLAREAVPVTYPQPPGWVRLAKADDDSLFIYQRSADILVLDGGFTLLGTTKRWW